MTPALVCWRCGGALKMLPLPLSRLAECPSCRAELHACRLCLHYDASTQRQCREIRAEEIVNKEQANFCDWFKPRANAFDARAQIKAATAKSGLDALFGGAPAETPTDPAREKLDQLFGAKGKKP